MSLRGRGCRSDPQDLKLVGQERCNAHSHVAHICISGNESHAISIVNCLYEVGVFA